MDTQLTLTQTQVGYLLAYSFIYVSKATNSALAYHNAQLEAAAFREEFDPELFEDLTLPNYKAMHKVDLITKIAKYLI